MVVAIMGGADRKGAWTPGANLYVTAVMGGAVLDFRQAQVGALALMGGVELDLREAVLAPGVTELNVIAIMGGVEIIVPPGLRVESNGIGIMGGFEHAGQLLPDTPSGPVLRISGVAIMGGVEIKERPLKRIEPGGA